MATLSVCCDLSSHSPPVYASHRKRQSSVVNMYDLYDIIGHMDKHLIHTVYVMDKII